MNRSRPVNLNLFKIRFPLPAIVSILHRISGVCLFLLLPFALWLLSYSFTETGFNNIHQWLSNPFFKLVFWLALTPYLFHLVAGIRHLLSDIHIGDTLPAGRYTSILTFIISALLILMLGVWLW